MNYLQDAVAYFNSVTGRDDRNYVEASKNFYRFAKANGVPSQQVEAGDDGLEAGTVQEALQSLATRVQALENAS